MADRYDPTGVTAMARQHPLLKREDHDIAALAAAEEKRKRKAARRAGSAEPPAPTKSPGKEFGGAIDRRLAKRVKKLGI